MATVLMCAACGGADDGAKIDEAVAMESTVDVAVRGCGGGDRGGVGTVIDDSGLVVTAAHVVAGASAVEIETAAGTRAAEIVYFDPEQDVAALQPTEALGNPASLAATRGAPGDSGIVVTVIGATRNLVPVEVVRTATVQTTDIYLEDEVERSGYEIDAAIERGDSGAMVHVADGGIGIVWARSTTDADRAWVVELPDDLTDPARRAALTNPVDAGPCA